MKKSLQYARRSAVASLAIGSLALAASVHAADHSDSPKVQSEPSADLADMYGWTSSDGSKLNLVLTAMPYAEDGAMFGDATQYAFHVHAHPAFGEAPAMSTLILCQFYDANMIECWARRDGETVSYIEGDASDADGLDNEDGTLKVFAGRRNDPFYFNGTGFGAAASTVRDAVAADALTFDGDGCPDLDMATSNALVTQLMTAPDGGAASDFYAGTNVMALVMQVDMDLVSDSDNRVFSLWSTTHAAE